MKLSSSFSNMLPCVLLTFSTSITAVIANPLPLSILNEDRLSGEYESIQTLRLTFKGANRHLTNLADILRPVPGETANSISFKQRRVLVRRTFGALDDLKLSFLRRKVDEMLARTAKIKVGKVRVDYSEMDAESREDKVLAGYSRYLKDVEFTAYFYDMAIQRCREHALIHEAAHAIVGAFDFFKEVVPDPRDPEKFHYVGSFGPESEERNTELLNGYEHEDLEELIEFGDGITLFNAESYAQAAIRATQIKELGHDHIEIQLPSFEDCVPGPPRPPGGIHPTINVWRYRPATGTAPSQRVVPPRTRLHTSKRRHQHAHQGTPGH